MTLFKGILSLVHVVMAVAMIVAAFSTDTPGYRTQTPEPILHAAMALLGVLFAITAFALVFDDGASS